VRHLLIYPFHYNQEYIEESGIDVTTIPQLNELNQKVLNAYNLINSPFNIGFEFALSVEFETISRLRLQYICNMFYKIKELADKHQEYIQQKETHKAEVKALVKRK
jgi:hypothetical protein